MNKENLFNLVFEDGEEFTDFYFNKRRNKTNVCSRKHEDNVVALVNYVDIKICGDGKQYKSALISGVCTRPDMRGKGIMKSLLSNLLDILQIKNYDIAVLSPVHNDIYKQFGFESLTKGEILQLNAVQNNDFSLKKATKTDIKLLLDLYDNISKSVPYSQVLTEEIALDLLEEFSMQNCSIEFVCKKGQAIGWIAISDNKVEIAIVENLAILQNIKRLDGYKYFVPSKQGCKDLFQIKYLKDNIDKININEIMLINKY